MLVTWKSKSVKSWCLLVSSCVWPNSFPLSPCYPHIGWKLRFGKYVEAFFTPRLSALRIVCFSCCVFLPDSGCVTKRFILPFLCSWNFCFFSARRQSILLAVLPLTPPKLLTFIFLNHQTTGPSREKPVALFLPCNFYCVNILCLVTVQKIWDLLTCVCSQVVCCSLIWQSSNHATSVLRVQEKLSLWSCSHTSRWQSIKLQLFCHHKQ